MTAILTAPARNIYRVQNDKLIVIVAMVGHRRDVYEHL